jgi:hypothetical protein
MLNKQANMRDYVKVSWSAVLQHLSINCAAPRDMMQQKPVLICARVFVYLLLLFYRVHLRHTSSENLSKMEIFLIMKRLQCFLQVRSSVGQRYLINFNRVIWKSRNSITRREILFDFSHALEFSPWTKKF